MPDAIAHYHAGALPWVSAQAAGPNPDAAAVRARFAPMPADAADNVACGQCGKPVPVALPHRLAGSAVLHLGECTEAEV